MRLPALHQSPALQPSVLNEMTAQAVQELLQEGQSAHTLASYRSALRYWAAWFGLRYGITLTLPLPANCILQFIVDHAPRTSAKGLVWELPQDIDRTLVELGYKGKPGSLAQNTLSHRIAVMSKVHQLQGLPNPCRDAKVRELLSRTRVAYAKRGELANKKAALTKEPLLEMLQTCDDSLTGLRDRALLLFAWASGGRRRSEVASADFKFLRREGPAAFTYDLRHSKNNQSGQHRAENIKPIYGMAGEALQGWLAAAGHTEGRVFRRVLKGGHLGGPLSAAAVREIVKKRALLAGLHDDFSAHSLRAGFVTEASQQQQPLSQIMAMTGHRSIATLMGYARTTGLENRIAKLLE